ncbi:2bf350cb-5b58-4acc-952e-6c1148ad9d0e [Sclerotinia trifoliorum]|uniref:Histone acetyltransferase type B catalytic subunit n=1 Tax=Sclerotinia trifoliorum TaxID=28548 RepID=A0A8H2VZP6_9HELO|nr:2bf350cb-5b58-4acc-952e-6c1148ad9d0e [Sclerotinia trifoliorum]
MADVNADWAADSNEAIYISLVTPSTGATTSLHTFTPKFTYPIFGDEESIFGYQGLRINLKYNACDMRPGLQITYNKRFKAVGDIEPTDLKATLEPFLPKTAFEKSSVFDSNISAIPADWHPPGELFRAIEVAGETFEIWKGILSDPVVQQTIKRIQILVPLFIEGGTLLDLDESEDDLERWTVFFLYHKKPPTASFFGKSSSYVFMGFSTVYRYYMYTPTTPPQTPNGDKIAPEFTLPVDGVSFNTLPCRSRISQFMILPPFQSGGKGSLFYNAIFDYLSDDPYTREITVEDPNEAFDDLRDINDLARLRKDERFLKLKLDSKLKINPKGPAPTKLFDTKSYEELRTQVKIAPRQFARVHEMYLLSIIPQSVKAAPLHDTAETSKESLPPPRKEDEHTYHLWQLLVKQRLYRHNKEALAQLDRGERIDKLNETLMGVEADYGRLIEAVNERSEKEKRTAVGKGKGKSTVNESGKRAVSGGDEDEDDGEDENDVPLAKRLKFAS